MRFGHEVLAVTPDGRGIARWWVSFDVPGEGIDLEGIFLVTLDEAGAAPTFASGGTPARGRRSARTYFVVVTLTVDESGLSLPTASRALTAYRYFVRPATAVSV